MLIQKNQNGESIAPPSIVIFAVVVERFYSFSSSSRIFVYSPKKHPKFLVASVIKLARIAE